MSLVIKKLEAFILYTFSFSGNSLLLGLDAFGNKRQLVLPRRMLEKQFSKVVVKTLAAE